MIAVRHLHAEAFDEDPMLRRLISNRTEPMLGLRMLRGPTPISLPTPARPLRSLLALAALASALAGCKSDAKSAPPMAPLDDLAAIESELDANASRLQAQGIRLAQATMPAPAVEPAEAKLGGDDDASHQESERDFAGDLEPAPAAPPEPEDAPSMDSAAEESVTVAGRSAERKQKRSSRRRDKKAADTRCDRICDLAESTCALSDRICALANEHVDDVRYAEACTRAEAQCEAAAEACTACAD